MGLQVKEAGSFNASHWLTGLWGHLEACVVDDGKLAFRTWGHCVKKVSPKYV